MTNLEKIIRTRRDTRHFTKDAVPDSVMEKALADGHHAPSVGLTDATQFYIIKSDDIKKAVKNLFLEYDAKAVHKIETDLQKKAYQALKLEAILEAPIGLVICYDRSVLNDFTIGTVGSNESLKFSAVCAAQNIWLSLTEQGFSMGWVSILNYYHFKELLGLPEHIEPLGYFCVGKPATDYDQQPMLQQLQWKNKKTHPFVQEITKTPLSRTNFSENKSTIEVENSTQFREQVQKIIDNKTKPTRSLGVLEDVAKKLCTVFQSLTPQINKPNIVVFAADHGIANHGVSAYPQEVTRQMVTNFLEGGAAINVFCKQNRIELNIVDAGVNYDFPTNTALISAKVAKGTQSFAQGPAMSLSELQLCFVKGRGVIKNIAKSGSNCVGFGEMGIGNTATAAVLMSVITQIPIESCVGKGTGIANEKLAFKTEILRTAIQNSDPSVDLEQKLAYFGGFEILQMAGGMLQAKENNLLILVDGFISTVAFLIALQFDPHLKQNALFCHCSTEKGHQLLLDFMEVKPLLELELRLGEGTGCALAFPIIESAAAFFNNMASFESAGIIKK